MSTITYRKATADDIRPALDLALQIFIQFELPDYEPGAIEKFKNDCIENKEYINNYASGKHLMFVAVCEMEIIGIINERGNGRISMLFVDGRYHRRGIATKLMERMVCELKLTNINKITVHSSPYGVPFYKHFGFTPTDTAQKNDCFIVTPMEYIISMT